MAAWRHIVTVFRALGAGNVTWLWTVNIINDTQQRQDPFPGPWWPGSSYVTWVGIDGYYLKPSWQFAPLFGPTIGAVRALTGDPILIAETGAMPAAGQPAKIADLFAGIHAYGLLGFVWFDSTNSMARTSASAAPRPSPRSARRQHIPQAWIMNGPLQKVARRSAAVRTLYRFGLRSALGRHDQVRPAARHGRTVLPTTGSYIGM